jgi:Ca-activated chloride channel homolog
MLVCALASAVCATPARRSAATPGAPATLRHAPASPQIAVQVAVVSVPVTVTDARGEFVGGLTRDNFRLFVDGTERPIEYFAAEAEPAKVLLLIETGPAVYLLRREHTAAALLLLQGLGGEDRAAIASYSQAPQLLLGFTADKRQAAAALGAVDYGFGMAQLNFYDSLAAATDWAGSRDGAGGGKSAIVALTTGLDSSGPGHWERLESKLQQNNVMVLPVALGGELRDYKGNDKAKRGTSAATAAPDELSFAASDRALAAIAAETGGYAFFPRSTNEFEAAYRRIAGLLRHEYNVGFSAPERDARYHEIRVEVLEPGRPAGSGTGAPPRDTKRKPKYTWNARRGFLAPSP